ncbi:hypothetical protein F4777DRAFT_198454 [Nemania sp. FL0916]|nr:hypothetical protein F4777DRAFT_198454 [Nemania sp. FL0916]
MQTKFVVASLLFLVGNVLAGGYAGALERVWLFYAYQIDGLNDPADQTIGWKCTSWDDQAGKCRTDKNGKEKWVQCKGLIQPGRRCTFSQLLNFLGGASPKDQLMADSSGNLLPQTDTNPDPEQTAKKVYTHFLAQPKNKVPDWQPYRIIYKGDADYVDSINKVADVVAKASADGKNTAATKQLFERFSETTTQIKTARVGDHGPYLIAATEQKLNPKGITVVKEKVGTGQNPVDASKVWETVDWEKTMEGPVTAKKYTEAEILKITDDTKEEFYNGDSTAQDHRVVIQSYDIAENKAKGCV